MNQNNQQSQTDALVEELPVNDAHVTLDDVRAIINADPSTITSGAKVRAKLGRGGLTTIQKHLAALRDERAMMAVLGATPQATPPAPPAMPAALAANLWSAAWSTAQQALLGHLMAVTAERDTAKKMLSDEHADIVELRDELDRAEAAAKQSAMAASVDRAAMSATKDAADVLSEDLNKEIAVHASALNAQRVQHEIQLREEAIKRETLQAALQRAGQDQGQLVTQIAEASRKNDDLTRKNDELVSKLSALAGAASIKRD